MVASCTINGPDRPPRLRRLNPALKLAWLVWLSVAVFCADRAWWSWLGVAVVIALFAAGGVMPWRIPGKRLWIPLAAALLVTQVLAVREGGSVWWVVTDLGIQAGLRASGRLLAVVLASLLFVVTTEPFALAAALMKLGLPDRWGFALVTALRLAPLFRVEGHHIYRAQVVRGVACDACGPRRWWLLCRHLCLPLLVSALRTAEALAVSMEGRAFGVHPRRTSLREMRTTGADVACLVLLIACVAGSVVYALIA